MCPGAEKLGLFAAYRGKGMGAGVIERGIFRKICDREPGSKVGSCTLVLAWDHHLEYRQEQ